MIGQDYKRAVKDDASHHMCNTPNLIKDRKELKDILGVYTSCDDASATARDFLMNQSLSDHLSFIVHHYLSMNK